MKRLNLYLKSKKFDFSSFLLALNVIFIFDFTVGSDGLFIFETVFQILRDFEPVNNSVFYYFGRDFDNQGLGYFSAVLFLLALASFFVSFTKFSFLHKKKLSTAIFTFPQTRNSMFKEKAIKPIIILVASVIIAKTICLFANVLYNGFTWHLFSVYIASTLIYIQYVVYGYLLGILSRMLTGRVIEGLFTTVSLFFFPKAIYILIHIISSTFLYGYSNLFKNSPELTLMFDPTRHLADFCQNYNTTYSVTPVPYKSIIASSVMIILLFTVLFIAKRYFSKHFKVEEIGFSGINRVINIINSITLPIVIVEFMLEATFIISSKASFNTARTMFAFILILLASLLLNTFINRKIKFTKEKCVLVGSFISFVLVTTVITSLGGLGFEKRVPKAEAVASIEISSPMAYHVYEFDFGKSFSIPEGFLSYTSALYDYPTFITEKSDIEIVKEIHEFALNNKGGDKTSDHLMIKYTLNNGSVITRLYPFISSDISFEALRLWDLKATKEYQRKILSCEYLPDAEEYDYTDSVYQNNFIDFSKYENSFSYENGTPIVGVISKDFEYTAIREKGDKPLSKESFEAIKDALYKDFVNIPAKDFFAPEKTYGFIAFSGFYTNKSKDEQPKANLNSFSLTSKEYFDKEKNQTNYNINGDDFRRLISIPVTSEMKNLLEVIEKLGYTEYLTSTKNVRNVYLADKKDIVNWLTEDYTPTIKDIFEPAFIELLILSKQEALTQSLFDGDASAEINLRNYYYRFQGETPPTQKIISKEAQIELLEKSHACYFAGNEGSIIFIEGAAPGSFNCYYIP